MNINTELFKRYQPTKKLAIIEALTQSELLGTTEDTIKRIVKEVGHSPFKTLRDRRLFISKERETGNRWNSTFEGVSVVNGKLYIQLYLQYGNTDTTATESYDKFFGRGNYRGDVKGSDLHGNTRYHYINYDEADKAKAMKSILLEYVHRKYYGKGN